jgi:hypothetical protein
MVNLTHEASLLQKIEDLATNRKIQITVGLTAQDAETKIQKLIPTTHQRLNAARFYLDLMESVDYTPYITSKFSLSTEKKPLIDFSDSDLHVQINLLNPDTFPLVVFIVLHGFFSNIVSSDDCVAKVINIVYGLLKNDRNGSKIRQELENKIPNGLLTRHLRNFHLVSRSGNSDQIGFSFSIAKQIRNQLTHDHINDLVDFPTIFDLSGPLEGSTFKLHFNPEFFPANISRGNTELITFCNSVFKETVGFVDECYRLILGKLQHSGVLPVL